MMKRHSRYWSWVCAVDQTQGGLVISAVLLMMFSSVSESSGQEFPPLRRADIINTAKAFAEYSWVAKQKNLSAPCKAGPRYSGKPYHSNFSEGQIVVGVPYDWGGIDGVDDFAKKLILGFAAGSHKEQECDQCRRCTTGIDCSGFVLYCWGQRVHDWNTNSMTTFGNVQPASFNPRTDLQPGDALNHPGDHIMLFDSYQSDGRPVLYEAAGGIVARVVRRSHNWAEFEGWVILRYRNVVQ